MEKRRGKRYKRRMKIRFGLDEAKQLGFVEDISTTGLRIKTGTVYKPGLSIKMQIEDEKTGLMMEADGLVRWARKVPPSMMAKHRCGMGIAFMKIDASMHGFLMSLRGKETYDDGSG